jgi:hypothetical protein
MIQTTFNTFPGVPTANVTVNRNRVKNYGNAVYMKAGTAFEIEIFNPLTNRVMVAIEIDGKLISSTGLVVNPGQRVYLERWIDEPRKFKFSTYDVENSAEAAKAIANNGKIKVSFYEEVNKHLYPTFGNPGIIYTNTGSSGQPYYYNYDSGNLTIGSDLNFGGTTTSNFFSSTSLGVKGSMGPSGVPGEAGRMMTTNSVRSKSSIETGRTEKGEGSNQGFDSTSGDFNSWPTATIEMQILPESQKPVEIEKVRSYCTDCGTRVRSSSWKFCPSCGSKF